MNILIQIIVLTDTWLNDSNMNYYSLEKHTYISSNRSKRKGGVVGSYVSNQLDSKIRNYLTKNLEDIIETAFIEILTNVGKNIIIKVIYRPPNNKFNEFKDIINEILENINKQNKFCYLMGDFNIDSFKLESCNYAS